LRPPGHLHCLGVAAVDEAVVHQLLQALLLEESVDERDDLGKMHVEDATRPTVVAMSFLSRSWISA